MSLESSSVASYSSSAQEATPHCLRILVVGHGYPPKQMAGAEQQMRRKVNWWHAHGHTVRVVAADPRLSSESPFGQLNSSVTEVDGVLIHRLKFGVADGTRPLHETYAHPLLGPELRRHVQEFRPEIIYQVSGTMFGLHPLEIAAEYDIPSVLFATDFWHRCQRHTLMRPDGSCCRGPRHAADCASCRMTARRPFAIFGPAAQRLSWSVLAALEKRSAELFQIRTNGVRAFEEREERIQRALANVGLVVCNSRFLTDRFAELGVERERILTVRQGLDDISRPEPRCLSRGSECLHVLYLGQVTRHKGVDLLASAVARLVKQELDIDLHIYGPHTDDLLEIDSHADERITVGSPLSREAIVRKLAESDVLVVPSRWFENSPNVILEAQAMAVPVVAANHGGMAEMVRDGVDGLLFEPGSAASLERALRRLVLDRDLLNLLASNAPRPQSVSVEMHAEEKALAALVRGRRCRASATARS